MPRMDIDLTGRQQQRAIAALRAKYADVDDVEDMTDGQIMQMFIKNSLHTEVLYYEHLQAEMKMTSNLNTKFD